MPPRNEQLETLAALRNIQHDMAVLVQKLDHLAAELRQRDASDAMFRAALHDLVRRRFAEAEATLAGIRTAVEHARDEHNNPTT